MIVTTDAMCGMIMHREDRIRPQGAPPETSAAADVEIVDERDKDWRMASANNAAGSGADTATVLPVEDAEASDKAYYTGALDALAADYIAFEATLASVTSEHEAGHATHAATAETAGELERAQKDQANFRTTWTVCVMIWLRPPGSSPTAGHPTRPRAQNCATPSWTSATDVRLTKQSVSMRGRRCIVHMKLSAKPPRYKKAWRHTGSEQDASRTITPERKATSVTELAPWVEQYKPRPKPRTA